MVFSLSQNDSAQGSHMTAEPMAGSAADGKVTIVFDREQLSVPRRDGETLLESARRAGMTPPFSCEAGNCGTCMAKLLEGTATMRVNDALDDDEVAEGYVLTCQAVPDCASVTVSYDED
ncbi:2Fe-2S iron-sulfur cluster binding domain-containing protein [Mycobacterium sp. TNTM28]|uniref:2Fe-2S iron-sulfur cluster binding domain-containing protein n=2 Tax=[Mycobacterium] fortunisiensis TaxID=2600579 RepID=A0ABS6KQZ0_9MYCO|nr:2Fe-2S iron-sulfur cluster binding domain-containing protein [[Mycobacterium] fortunisiensis]